VIQRYQVPEHYLRELIEGMAMDVRGTHYENSKQLLLYAYRVAGVVGLIMAHIMGVSSEHALQHASDLGKAMQLTNIARDVFEDAALGRLYLPADLLRQAGVSDPMSASFRVDDPQHRRAVFQAVRELLAKAEQLYESAEQGIAFLPLRAAFAIQAAREIYSAIGHQILERGERALESRSVVSFERKIALTLKALLKVACTLPKRFFHSFRPVEIASVLVFDPELGQESFRPKSPGRSLESSGGGALGALDSLGSNQIFSAGRSGPVSSGVSWGDSQDQAQPDVRVELQSSGGKGEGF
ncbi:MAG: phytoene/squalene synthase family protein, partial [Bdellovibrionia bacterium]